MTLYKINVVFKNKTAIIIEAQSDKNPKDELEQQWTMFKKGGYLPIGDYIFDINEVWYIKVESDRLVEHTGEQLQNNRTKKL